MENFKKFESNALLKQIMAKHFQELNEASAFKNRKIAWCSSVGPAELLRSMGFLLYFPENHAAMIGAGRYASNLIPAANSEGFSPDICSYLTSDIGAFIQRKTALSKSYGINSVPRPDLLVYNTNQCRDIKEWFKWYSRRLNVPCIGVESFCNLDNVNKEHIKSIRSQFEGLIPKLEEIAETKFDIDRLREVMLLSARCSELWGQILETAVNLPSPVTFYDCAIHMGPAVILRATIDAIVYYEKFLAELHERIRKKIPAVDNECYRIYWEGMPIWGKLSTMAKRFMGLKACVVASTYCNSWIFSGFDKDSPFDAMAKAYTELFIVRSESYKEQYIENMVKRYDIDGILFHEAKTCPNNSNTRYGMSYRLRKKLNIPTIIIHGDPNDLGLFSEAQSATRIEAFIEQIENKRKNNG